MATALRLAASLLLAAAGLQAAFASAALANPLVAGCADGQREGFTDLAAFPKIAGCGGGWSIPGLSRFDPGFAPACPGLPTNDSTVPACGGQAGDDSANPGGVGCNSADLCAPGWHVCLSSVDVVSSNASGCTGATKPGDPQLLFLTRQSSNGCGVCASGTNTGPDCNSAACTPNCLQTDKLSNDVFGCGNYGAAPSVTCSPLDRFSNNLCSSIAGQGWSCNDPSPADNSGLCESYTIVHSNPATGGVLCCKDGDSPDSDGDGVLDDTDNCIGVPNPGQEDGDLDGYGDACDPCDDFDDDGKCDGIDNCPQVANPQQADSDGDGDGDACDACPLDAADDADGDGTCDDVDNCPGSANDQTDTDGDGAGDACDACPLDASNDADGDGTCENDDNCPGLANDQTDNDADGAGDACDPCAFDSTDDIDGDGTCEDQDNCPSLGNDQTDSDGDGAGDACDQCPFDAEDDADGDGLCGDVDQCAGTTMPESVPTVSLGVNHWALTSANGVFQTTPPKGKGPSASFTIQDTGGCSCEQIIAALGLGEGHKKHGCSLGVMREWVAKLADQ